MTISESYLQILRECSRDDNAFQRLVVTLEPVFDSHSTQQEAYQAQLAAIVESSPNAIIDKTLDGIITSWNPAAEAIYGYTANEAIGHPIALIIPPERSDEMESLLAEVRQGEEVVGYETVRLCKNGSRLDILLTVSPIKDKNGNIIGVASTAQDITKRNQIESALEESRKELELLFNILPVGVSVLDQENKLVVQNPALEKILGITHEGLGRGDYRSRQYLRANGTRMPAEEFPSTRVQNGETEVHNVEIGVVKENGDVVWTNVSATACPYLNWKVVIVITDITEWKQAQQQILQLEAEHERIRLLKEFIADTSHELRTPLTVIATSVYGMVYLDDREQRKAKIKRVEQQIAYLTTMINEFQEMAGLGQMTQLSTKNIQLSKLVERLIADYSVGNSNAVLDYDLNSHLPIIQGNPDYVSCALKHLLDNAVRYSPDKGIITIRTAVQDDQVILAVEDHGIGIAPEHRERIFEHFYKVNHARTRNDNGAGMGLALVKRIMQLHHGRVTVQSEVGQGSIFRLHFPSNM